MAIEIGTSEEYMNFASTHGGYSSRKHTVFGTITKEGKGAYWRIPSQPEEIKVSYGASVQSLKLIDLGQIKQQRGDIPLTVSWDGIFWGADRQNKTYLLDPGEWVDPETAAMHVKGWCYHQDRLLFFVSGTNINYVGFVSSFTWKYSGGHGDIKYSITITKCREATIKQTAAASASSPKATTTPRETPKPSTSNLRVNTNKSPLHLRTSANGKIIGHMPKNATITTDGQKNGNWQHVCYNGTWGWAYTRYLKTA